MVHWLILIFKIIVFYLLLLNRQNKKGQRTSVAARQIHKRYKDCFAVDKLGFIKKKKKKYDVQMIVFTTLLEKL